MAFFKVIIPNYNSESFIKKCLDSILSQTFTDFEIVIADDMSTDNSVKIIKQYKDERIHLVENKEKRYNGGSRNVGIDYPIDSKYTLFIDNDDWFERNTCFQEIYLKIKESNYPDCVSWGYYLYKDNDKRYVRLIRNSPKDLVHDLSVACWTKCIKSDLIVHFPENTLMEDVSQHIEQCDKLNTCTSIDKGFIVWNRNNLYSCSTKPSKKRMSSEWRQLADVFDLELQHDYCIEEKKRRIEEYLRLFLKGKHVY